MNEKNETNAENQKIESSAEAEAEAYKVTGVVHIWAAFNYSIAGLKRLWQETAFRHATAIYCIAIGLFLLIGSPWWSFLGMTAIYFMVGGAESLNTAIEELVDHISPQYSETAKHAKDLGSLAVMFMLLVGGLWLVFVVVATLM